MSNTVMLRAIEASETWCEKTDLFVAINTHVDVINSFTVRASSLI